MKWRAFLGIVAGLLLPIPLLLLLGGFLQPTLRGTDSGRRAVSPVLDTEERTRRVTYRRYCSLSSECEPPLGCLSDTRLMTHYCTDSRCRTDEECPQGQLCQSLATTGDGPLVRLCIPIGVRQEGEHCLRVPHRKEAACGPGLLCSGEDGWCARPCSTGDAASCPEGFFCADVAPQPVCLPTCERRGCPEGQQCIHSREGSSTCAQVYGPHCQQTPCPDNRECDVGDVTQLPGKVWTECVEPCGEGRPPCSAGLVCDGWHCLPPCDPQGPDTCAEGYRCNQRKPNRPWVCQPDWPED
jgi:hypothetical protein